MSFRSIWLACLLVVTVSTASAQNASITLMGGMDVSEGGTGTLLGRVTDAPTGQFGVNFGAGTLLAVRSTRVQEVVIPGATSFFSGQGVAAVIENGQLVLKPGQFFVMVDDLDLDGLPHPDQFFLQFRFDNGQVETRHGLMTRGDITIRL